MYKHNNLKAAAILLSFILCHSCLIEEIPLTVYCKICMSAEKTVTRSSDPEENKLSDFNVFIFDKESGVLEYSAYFQADELNCLGLEYSFDLKLKRNTNYTVHILANAGYSRTDEVRNADDLKSLRVHFAYPDEYRRGIPMSGTLHDLMITESKTIDIKLERLMSKISVAIDRSRLDKDVSLKIRSLSVGNCPRYVIPFTQSAIVHPEDAFTTGFTKSGNEVSALNEDNSFLQGNEVSVYLFENMQGNLLEGITDEKEKILDTSHPAYGLCSYIEIAVEYSSEIYMSQTGEYLIYRFYLGESPENFDVARNSHYRFTLIPENDGLSESSWRIDRSALVLTGEPYMKVFPGNHIIGKTGERHHIWCEYFPPDADFDIGLAELEYDKARGIYDYVLDSNGKGVTLHLKKKGSGILYFRTEHPVNQEEMIYIEVE